jgi:pimeloyl-ACP methyl ester carboxylesterase
VAYAFTSNLALLSRSGMVVIPVCDTPYGSDPSRHGDSGKDVILMEMVRYVLAREGIAVSGYSPVGSMGVTINGVQLVSDKDLVGTRLATVGWSHGAILARRFAHAYPSTVKWLGQVCPAGYERWDSWQLSGRFARESLRILFNGHTADTLRSGWGFTKGFMGDFFRSIPAAVTHLDAGKVGRVGKDIKDCTLYCDSSRFSAAHVDRIVVIFGRDDSCMDPQRQLGIKDPDSVAQDDLKHFQETFFADIPEKERIILRILKGTHLAPVIHNDLYARTLLAGFGQIHEP